VPRVKWPTRTTSEKTRNGSDVVKMAVGTTDIGARSKMKKVAKRAENATGMMEDAEKKRSAITSGPIRGSLVTGLVIKSMGDTIRNAERRNALMSSAELSIVISRSLEQMMEVVEVVVGETPTRKGATKADKGSALRTDVAPTSVVPKQQTENYKFFEVPLSEDWEDVMAKKFEDCNYSQLDWAMEAFDCKGNKIDMNAEVVKIDEFSFPLHFGFTRLIPVQ